MNKDLIIRISKKISPYVALLLLFAVAVFAYLNSEKNAGRQPSPDQAAPTAVFDSETAEGRHDNLQTEWWYFAGHLQDSQKPENKFGVTLIFHKNPARIVYNLIDGEGQNNFSDLILLDKYDILDRNNFSIKSGNNYWIKNSDGYEIHFEHGEQKINLQLEPLKEPFVSSLGDTFYYQQTRLAASGTLDLSRQKHVEVAGTAWSEHQGFKNALGWQSWRWFSLQLDNNIEMAFARDLKLKNGNFFEKNPLYIFNDKRSILRSDEYSLNDLEFWTDEKTGKQYPIKWELDIPGLKTALIIQAIAPNQTIEKTNGFYEGSCLISGTYEEKSVSGRAQFEYMP